MIRMRRCIRLRLKSRFICSPTMTAIRRLPKKIEFFRPGLDRWLDLHLVTQAAALHQDFDHQIFPNENGLFLWSASARGKDQGLFRTASLARPSRQETKSVLFHWDWPRMHSESSRYSSSCVSLPPINL
jgi:hypothetical protein